jgi:hypothetical protein
MLTMTKPARRPKGASTSRDMLRRLAFVVAGLLCVTAITATQVLRAPAGSDHFTGTWIVNPAKTVNWTGRDNTSFEVSTLTVENDVQSRDVETAYGVADENGVQRHNRRRNSVKYNEFDPAKANATNVSVFGNALPPMTPAKTDDHLVTLKVDDRTHISFNKNGGGFFRHMSPDLKEYAYVGFTADGTVPLHRWFYRVKKTGDPNIPGPQPLAK